MAQPTHPPIPVMGNRYKIICTNANGKASVHYGAFDLFTSRTACITAVSKRQGNQPEVHYPLNKVRSDSNFCLKILHPDILHVYDHFEDDDNIYLVSEFSDIRPVSEMEQGSPRPGATAFFAAIQKVIYAVEYYHSNQCLGCFIRPQHVRLSDKGEVLIDHLLDCRLSYLSDVKKEAAQKILKSAEDATALDISCAGKTVIKLLEEMPKPSFNSSRKDVFIQDVVPALKKIAEQMCDSEYTSIKLVSKALNEIENKIRGDMKNIERAFPSTSRRLNLAAGEILFSEGAPHNGEAFIVERGMIQISKSGGKGRDSYLDVSRPGDIVGEMALIDHQPRMATARAIEPSTLVVVTGKEFNTTLEKMNSVGRLLVKVLVKRLRLQAKEVARLKSLIGVER